jgi:hypothetical protein
MNRHIINLAIVSALLLSVFGVQYFTVKAHQDTTLDKSFIGSAAPTNIFLPLVLKNQITTSPLWRLGAGKVRRAITEYDPTEMVSMRFGWYQDYKVTNNAPEPYGMEYIPVVRVKQLKLAADGVSKSMCCVSCSYWEPYGYTVTPSVSEIQSIAANHPGMTWLIGNEIDRIDSTSTTFGVCLHQDEILPELYAQAYHDIYYAIKDPVVGDPTAQVAIGGMVEFTPLRSQYLDRVWAEYTRLANLPENNWVEKTMPVDVWNIHMYVLREEKDGWGADIPPGLDRESPGMLYNIEDNKDFSLAWDQIVSLRTWMKDHGQQSKPLIISEYGVNFPSWVLCDAYPDTTGCPFTPEQVRDSFMYPSFDAFLNHTDANIGYLADGNRLVQRWDWFAIDFDSVKCENGLSYLVLGGALFNSGLNPPCSPNDFLPPMGISSLGIYWRQYVKNLPAGSTIPYVP